MAAKLKKKETMAAAVKAVVREESSSIIKGLRARRRDSSEPIHEARKSIKKIRALLRLTGPSMAGKTFDCENSWYRGIGSLLSDVRDAQVMIETIRSLRGGAPAGLRQELAGLATRFRERHAGAMKTFERTGSLAKILERLQRAQKRIADWNYDDKGWGIVHKGLRKSYGRGLKAMKTALATKRPEDFHEWRKRVKDLYYQERFLGPLWPQALESIGEMTHRLADVLGEDHDLYVLEDNLRKMKHALSVKLKRQIDARRRRLRSESKRLGAAVYKDDEKKFEQHFHDLWKAFPHG